MGARPPARVCGAEIPPHHVGTWGHPRSPLVPAGWGPGASAGAARPAAPTGSATLASPRPASLPASRNRKQSGAGTAAPFPQPRSQEGAAGAGGDTGPSRVGAGRCRWRLGAWGVRGVQRPVLVLFHSVCFSRSGLLAMGNLIKVLGKDLENCPHFFLDFESKSREQGGRGEGTRATVVAAPQKMGTGAVSPSSPVSPLAPHGSCMGTRPQRVAGVQGTSQQQDLAQAALLPVAISAGGTGWPYGTSPPPPRRGQSRAGDRRGAGRICAAHQAGEGVLVAACTHGMGLGNPNPRWPRAIWARGVWPGVAAGCVGMLRGCLARCSSVAPLPASPPPSSRAIAQSKSEGCKNSAAATTSPGPAGRGCVQLAARPQHRRIPK